MIENDSYKKSILKVSVVTIGGNCILAGSKLAVGTIANSGALISDAVHTASDVFSTFFVLLGVVLSRLDDTSGSLVKKKICRIIKKIKLERMATVILGIILGLTGVKIGTDAAVDLLRPDSRMWIMPGRVALIMAMIAIVTKEIMFRYVKKIAIMIKSDALMADAYHQRTDAFASVATLVGILGARLGYTRMDAVASLVLCVLIERIAFKIIWEGKRGIQ